MKSDEKVTNSFERQCNAMKSHEKLWKAMKSNETQ